MNCNKLCLLSSYQWLCWLVRFIYSVYLLSGKFLEFLQLCLLTNSVSRVTEDKIFTRLVSKLHTTLWQPRVLQHLHVFLLLARILMYINPIYNPWPLSSRYVSILSCYLSIVLPHDLIPSSFWTKTWYTFCFCLMPVACPLCLIVFICLSW